MPPPTVPWMSVTLFLLPPPMVAPLPLAVLFLPPPTVAYSASVGSLFIFPARLFLPPLTVPHLSITLLPSSERNAPPPAIVPKSAVASL
ncbi:hypothetical protein IIC38_18830 [candidate division KSB1 bacterium]|nr:hypothetical protein [candidate division KSB1 bacterium]